MRRSILMVLSLYLLLASLPVLAHSTNGKPTANKNTFVDIYMDGKLRIMGEGSGLKSKRSILVPLRLITENAGASIGWDPKERIATVSDGIMVMKFKADSNKVYINDRLSLLPENVLIYKDKMMVSLISLKPLVNSKGYELYYSNDAYSVELKRISY